MSEGQALRLDVHIELICPWCQIGLRHLQRVRAALLAEQPALRIELHWRLHRLLPGLPEQGLPFRAFYLQRLGSAAAVAARQAQVQAAGRGVGLSYDFERIPRMPDTALAHGLVRDAQAQLDPQALENLLVRLFAAHFQCGEDLGDPAFLLQLAQDHGIRPSASPPPAPVQRAVPGVPYFVVAQAYALSGAQSHEHLLALMRQALRPAPAVL